MSSQVQPELDPSRGELPAASRASRLPRAPATAGRAPRRLAGRDAHPRMEENVAALLPLPQVRVAVALPARFKKTTQTVEKPWGPWTEEAEYGPPHSGMFFNLKKRGRQFPLWCTGIGSILGALDAGSRPGLAQWMKELPLLQLWLRCTASVAWIRSLGELHMPRGAPPKKARTFVHKLPHS